MRFVGLAALPVMLALSVGSLWAQSVDLPQIVSQQRALALQLGDGSLSVTPRERNVVNKAQAEVFAIADGKATLAELNIAEKTRLDNALERINAVVSGGRRAQETQDVCWRERATGSKVAVTRCGTREEIEQGREGARGYLERPRICVPPGCGA